MEKKVVLGMSGGVDSSVCGIILKEKGYDVTGVFMKNWDEKDPGGACTAESDYEDVRLVSEKIGIPYYTVNFEKEYMDYVFEYFLDEYKSGRTPNPDVLCNQEIKFKAFLNYALKIDAEYIAMGHYARVEEKEGKFYLKRGLDENKDQSYFLCRVGQKALSKTIFPIGELKKEKVRKIAQDYNLSTADKKDSTGVCFIGERDFQEFLAKFLKSEKGDMIDVDTLKKVGRHTGLINYTLGQRKGIGIGGVGNGKPWFVCGKNLEKNILYVCQGSDNKALFSKGLIAEKPFFILEEKPELPLKCTAKFRYRQRDINVTLDEKDGNIYLEFDEEVKAVTPGQIACFYDGDYVIGSAIISRPIPVNDKYDFLNRPSKYGYVKDV